MMKQYMRVFLLALLSMLTVLPGFAIDYWTVGKVQAVLWGGEETAQAGTVYVSAETVENESAIAGVPSMMQTDPVMLSGASGSSAINKEYFFYAKANAGYSFLGFASTATGTPSGTGAAESMPQVGDYYSYSAKAGAGWSSNTAESAKVLTRYAVFQKNDDEEQGGDQGGDQSADTATVARVVNVTNQHGKNLIDAVLTVNDGENFEDGDIVTHIYVIFDHELQEITTMSAHAALADAVTLVNTTTGKPLYFNKYSCGVKGDDKHILDLFISTDCYINNSNYQGVYTVSFPAGIATSTNGLPTEAYSFSFSYGGTSGISGIAADSPEMSSSSFDLQGRHQSALVKGINIVNGKKIINK